MYTTDSAAKSSCNNDDNCKMVTDTACNGKEFKTCKGPITDSTIGSCAWSKGKRLKPFPI